MSTENKKLHKINLPKVRTIFDAPVRFSFETTGESMTQQSAKDECDVNIILKKYKTNGVLPFNVRGEGQFGDFSQVSDYQSALNQVLAAETAFNSLSATIREKFANDPGRFIAFMADPKNHAEALRLGLMEKRAEDPVEVLKTGFQTLSNQMKAEKTRKKVDRQTLSDDEGA